MNIFNKETMSGESVIAVKEAFIKALQNNGFTNEDKISEIRERLGLDRFVGESDISLESRRIKPLSRKEVRDIFDANAKEINECAKTVEGGVKVMTNDEVLTQKHHQQLKDKDLFSRTRDAINSANDTKFKQAVLNADRTKYGGNIKELHRHYIDCIVSGDFDRIPPEFEKQMGIAVEMGLWGGIFSNIDKPTVPEAMKLIGADRIGRHLTAVLEKEGKISAADIDNAIRPARKNSSA